MTKAFWLFALISAIEGSWNEGSSLLKKWLEPRKTPTTGKVVRRLNPPVHPLEGKPRQARFLCFRVSGVFLVAVGPLAAMALVAYFSG